MNHKAIAGIILFISLITCLLVNNLNVRVIKQYNPNNNGQNAASLTNGGTIFSVDNEYYLTPPENLLSGHDWQRSPPLGAGSYFRRTPGYSLLYFLARLIFPESQALAALKWLQVVLFPISALCFYWLLTRMISNRFLIVAMASFYAICPWFYSYTFFTLTESVSVYVILFYAFFSIRARQESIQRRKLLFYLASAALLGIAVLIRPVTAITGLILLYCLYEDFLQYNKFQTIKSGVLIFSIPAVFLLSWGCRNYFATGHWVFLEKEVWADCVNCNKPEIKSVWKFTKCWGAEHIWPAYNLFASRIINNNDSNINAESEIFYEAMPSHVKEEFSKETIFNGLQKFSRTLIDLRPHLDDSLSAPPDTFLRSETEVVVYFDSLTSVYKSKFPFRYYVITPLRYLGVMIFHSNTSNIFLFSELLRKNNVLNFIRLVLSGLHIMLWFLFLFACFFYPVKNSAAYVCFALGPLICVLFLIFYHQEIEQRYMLPFLPLMVIFIGCVLDHFISKSALKQHGEGVHR